MECGTQLGDARPPTSRWQITTAGSIVLIAFLAAGLTIWTFVLVPAGPRPGLGGASPRTAAAPAARVEDKPRTELPAEVKSFIAELVAKAKEKPGDVDTWSRLAQVNARAAQLDAAYQPDAIAAFEHVLELEPKNADALRGLANVYYDRDDHQKAIPVYERYLALRPDDLSARTDLGTMYLYAGQPERSIATYQGVIKTNPSFLQAHYNLAITYHGRGNDDGALKELETARGLATEDGVRKQIDDMIASLKGERPAAPAPSPSDAGRSPFQAAVETAFRSSPILGERIVRFEWSAPGSGRTVVRNFPMEAMPADVREKFTKRLAQEVRSAQGAHPVEGPVRLELADETSGKVMATVSP
jgi:tetratricopeptide (TPR) repeat protein